MGVASAGSNIITSTALALAGVFALAMALRARALPQPLPPAMASLASVALVVLAVDEGLEVHDRAGRWLYNEHGVVAPGPVNHVDDLFVLGYMAAGAVGFVALLPRLARYPWFVAGLLAAGALFAAGTAFDALGTNGTWTEGVEETAEATGAVALAVTIGGQAMAGARVRPRADSVRPETGEHPPPIAGSIDAAQNDASPITS